ncbi:MAG: hypothetical protein ACKOHG_14160 [Planctomycetia bacterium]
MRPRVVVLGASNVSRGLARLVAALQARAPGADLFVAAGHGRGYGVNTRVAARRLPSILGSGLWRAVDREPAAATVALVTDVGNELLYGFSAEQVASWVRESVRRLVDRGAMVAITQLPLAGIAAVGPIRYRALRTFFVPGCRLSLPDLKAAAGRLDDELQAIARECGGRLVEQPAHWYGLDTLHVRRRHLDDLWRAACAAWALPAAESPTRASLADWAKIGTRAAEVRSLAGVMRFTRQPVLELRGGGRLALY